MSDLDKKNKPLDPESNETLDETIDTIREDDHVESVEDDIDRTVNDGDELETIVVPADTASEDLKDDKAEPVKRGTVQEEEKARKKAAKKAKKPQVDQRNRILKRFSVFSIIFVVVVAILLNVFLEVFVGDKLTFDWTSNKVMTLGENSVALLESLDKEVEVYALTTREALESSQTDWLPTLLDEYVNKSGGKVKLEYVNPTVDPTIITKLDPERLAGVQPGQIVVRNTSTQRVRALNPREFINTRMDQQTGQTSLTGYSAEESISGAIKAMSAEFLPIVYLTTGHGEADAQQNYSIYLQLLKNNGFEVENYNGLLGEAIPEDAEALVMLSPTSDITTDEVQIYNDFLMKGGSLVALVPFSGTNYPNLNTLLKDFDIKLGDDRVIEGDVNYQFQQQPEAYFAHNPSSTILPSELIQNAEPRTLVLNGRNITNAQNAKEWIKTEPILLTSPEGALQIAGDAEDLSETSEQVVAMYSENNGSVDGSVVKEGAKVLVLGSDLIISDSILNAFGQSTYNLAIAYQSVAAMVDMEASMDDKLMIRPKPPVSYNVNPSNPSILMVAAAITTFVIPLLLVIMAIVVYQKRKNL